MICGFLSKQAGSQKPDAIQRMLGAVAADGELHVLAHGSAAFGFVAGRVDTGHKSVPKPAAEAPQNSSAIWQGEIYNRAELLPALGLTASRAQHLSDADLLVRLYDAYGLSCVEKINGSFAFALYDQRRQEVILGRDRLGIETLYYYENPTVFVFGSRISTILAHPEVPKELNLSALRRFLVFGYNPAWDTFFRGVQKVRPGRLLVLRRDGVTEKRYWSLSFRQVQEKPVSEYCHDILDLTRDSIRLRLPDSRPFGIFLSGGMDSSSVAGLAREMSNQNFATFSYRCLGRSFDESAYARAMAKHCSSEHHEVVYQPDDVRKMESMVRLMDEPFCNAGITVATFLLGQAAQGKVLRVLSGDGGDELFGGHPVYAADQIASAFEKIPSILRLPLVSLLQRLPDSDQKLNLTVKLKRFSESIKYPRALGTYRWRIHYGHDELGRLLQNGAGPRENDSESLFRDVIELVEEADGPDLLSRSLYVDTVTEVGFYLRRMDLVRNFQVTPAFPLLDHRLFEYAAAIPSELKFRDASNTKYIQHRAMEGVLPDEIVHRKDKLGHSIPFKNWLRSETPVKKFVNDTLSDQSLKRRGLVNSNYVQTLWDNHQSYRQNNSHRLWSIAVLELWLRANNL
jgi:asparagine synthase (glutamine-hydrolysing)